MSIKIENFKDFSDNELREIYGSLQTNLTSLPKFIKDYIFAENPVSGNVMTRTNRCMTFIRQEVFNRFMKGL